MRLVVDTNVVISALVRDSETRSLLLHRGLRLYAPEHMVEELLGHLELLVEKSGLGRDDLERVLKQLLSRIESVSVERFRDRLPEAFRVMKRIDERDAPFLALALSFANDGIWSDDRHLQKQGLVEVWTTKQMVEKGRTGFRGSL